MATKKITKKSNAKTTSKKKVGIGGRPAKTMKPSTATSAKGDTKNPTRSKSIRFSAPNKRDRPKRASGLDLAANVLAKAGKPLNAKTIADRVIAAGWKTSGLTPGATLYAAMTREITTKKDASRFRKVDRGLFVSAEGARA
jgi:hypothetical protein